jgi:hypothetical protein
MRCSFGQLDSSSQDYLRHLWLTRGKQDNGVFVYREAPSRPWGGRWFFLALLLAAVVTLISRPAPYSPVILGFQAGLSGLIFLSLAWGVVVLGRRRHGPAPVGSFTYVDGQQVWDVRGDVVTATPIESARDVNGQHRYINSAYSSSTLVIDLPGEPRTIYFSDQALAERLLSFINTLIMLRQPSDDGRVLTDPVLIGALAHQLTQGEKRVDPDKLNLSRQIPTPFPEDRPAPARRSSWRATLTPWLGAAVVAGVAWLAFPLLNDDLRFREADHNARQQHSPTRLREYLAEPRNTLHRQEAQAAINGFYDEAIARVKKLIEGKKAEPALIGLEGGKIDPNLSEGLLALLEALKTSDRPVVTVGFRGQEDPVPSTAEQKALEQFVYDVKLKKEAKLKDIADRSSEKTAILPSGSTFNKEQSARREQIILTQLRTAVNKVLQADILSLAPVSEDEEPVLLVAYHSYPSGSLYTYTNTEHPRFGPETETVKGLLRGFKSDWTITVRPPGGETRMCKLESRPALQLKYDSEPNDPDWAPYAIILYSSFDDMAARLVAGFGLDPTRPPDSYTFAQAVGGKK